MHANLNTQLEMQGDPNRDNEATSLYNLLCSNSFPCKVQVGSQSKFLFSLPRKTTTENHYCVFSLHLSMDRDSSWHKFPTNVELTSHVSLHSRSYVWAVGHPMPESEFFMN